MSQDLPTVEVDNLRNLRQSASIYLVWAAKDAKGFQVFRVQKFNSEGEPQAWYTIRSTNSGKDTVCDCPAHVDNCRHKRLLSYMIRFGGLNNPRKPIVTDGKRMGWLEYPGQLVDEEFIKAMQEQGGGSDVTG